MEKTVILTFDDAVISHLGTVAPILKSFGFGGTFFICGWDEEWLAKNRVFLLTMDQVKGLSDLGFEVGNHALTHKFMPEADAKRTHQEITELDQLFIDYGIPQPVSFGYPGGKATDLCADTLRRLGYRYARELGCAKCLNEPECTVEAFIQKETLPDHWEAAINKAKTGEPVTLIYHGVPDFAHDWVTTTIPTFLKQMQYLHDNGFTVLSMQGYFSQFA